MLSCGLAIKGNTENFARSDKWRLWMGQLVIVSYLSRAICTVIWIYKITEIDVRIKAEEAASNSRCDGSLHWYVARLAQGPSRAWPIECVDEPGLDALIAPYSLCTVEYGLKRLCRAYQEESVGSIHRMPTKMVRWSCRRRAMRAGCGGRSELGPFRRV